MKREKNSIKFTILLFIPIIGMIVMGVKPKMFYHESITIIFLSIAVQLVSWAIAIATLILSLSQILK